MIRHYQDLFEQHLNAWCARSPQNGLYAPMHYLLRLPGKRVRPVAVLMGCELFGGDMRRALDVALGIELFHNFTLMHDDIMDAAPLRRGRPTVHEAWSTNTAILSGDAMLVEAYRLMITTPQVLETFSRYALQVCEGQQLDMDFERTVEVPVAAYMEMIRLKTAVLLSCAFECGAIIAGADAADRERIGVFGERLGLAFQLRDDLLDAFGDPATTGKQQGGDLRAGKKTYLLIRALEIEKARGEEVLLEQLRLAPEERDVPFMLAGLERSGAPEEATRLIAEHERHGQEAMDAIQVPKESKEPVLQLAAALGARVH